MPLPAIPAILPILGHIFRFIASSVVRWLLGKIVWLMILIFAGSFANEITAFLKARFSEFNNEIIGLLDKLLSFWWRRIGDIFDFAQGVVDTLEASTLGVLDSIDVSGLISLPDNLARFDEFVEQKRRSLLDEIAAIMTLHIDPVILALGMLRASLKDVGGDIYDAIIALQTSALEAKNSLYELRDTFNEEIKTSWDKSWNAAITPIENEWRDIQETWEGFERFRLNGIHEITYFIYQTQHDINIDIKAQWEAHWQKLTTPFKQTWDAIQQFWQGIIDFRANGIRAITDYMVNFIASIYSEANNWIVGVRNAIAELTNVGARDIARHVSSHLIPGQTITPELIMRIETSTESYANNKFTLLFSDFQTLPKTDMSAHEKQAIYDYIENLFDSFIPSLNDLPDLDFSIPEAPALKIAGGSQDSIRDYIDSVFDTFVPSLGSLPTVDLNPPAAPQLQLAIVDELAKQWQSIADKAEQLAERAAWFFGEMIQDIDTHIQAMNAFRKQIEHDVSTWFSILRTDLESWGRNFFLHIWAMALDEYREEMRDEYKRLRENLNQKEVEEKEAARLFMDETKNEIYKIERQLLSIFTEAWFEARFKEAVESIFDYSSDLEDEVAQVNIADFINDVQNVDDILVKFKARTHKSEPFIEYPTDWSLDDLYRIAVNYHSRRERLELMLILAEKDLLLDPRQFFDRIKQKEDQYGAAFDET